jgi:vancomycin resistance protein YoaR
MVDEPGTVYAASRRRPWIWAAAALVVVLVIAAVVLVMTHRPAVVRDGRTIAGVAVGGLDGNEVRRVVDAAVRARVEQPVTVRVDGLGESFTLSPAAAGIQLDVDATVRAAFTGTQAALPATVTADQRKLNAALAAEGRPARAGTVKLAAPAPRLDAKLDTSFSASGRGVQRTAGTPGWGLDPARATAPILDAVRAGRPSATVTGTRKAPGTSPAELAGVDQLIGTFTTYHSCCQARVTNIHLIAKLVDGTVIQPGRTFSLNRKVGERTTAKGFVAAPAIVDGELDDQIGGGISQFSTTLFNASWFAGLRILEHQPHSEYISRYPPGREATLDWGNIDQVIRNDTDAPVVIRTSTTGTSVTVALYGHTGPRKVVSTTGPRIPTADEGFSISVERTIYAAGKAVGTDTLHWTYDGLD